MNLFGAFIDEKMIAGILNFIVNEHVVLAFYISHDEDYQEYRAVNFLFYSIFDWAIQTGLKVYDFGIFTVNEKPNMDWAALRKILAPAAFSGIPLN